ncbi:MAG: xanthine dehydrogenase family protein subunit M [Alphaproteobacteria bacterium]|jgi:CO/xanthine dehydrogenase FAD-binding subunit|nr:xanthine dehydrogenase family protein subunit M [Alphaproteobacteria bacterium]
MKPAPFAYHLAGSLEEACRLLAEGDDEAEHKVIAGGQTLTPLLAMRLARPALLIDLNRLPHLAGIDEAAGALVIGAMTRQRAVERSPMVGRRLPLLVKALCHVGHVQTRNRGTVGGSIVHADPSAEIPLVAVVLGARMHLAGAGSSRQVGADAFFQGPMTTAIAAHEILTAVDFPLPAAAPRLGTAFHEVALRHGDFALVSAAVQLSLDGDGRCLEARIGLGGCGLTPLRLVGAEAALQETALESGDISAAIATVADAIDPEDTPATSAAYRRRVAPELLRRAIVEAIGEAAP